MRRAVYKKRKLRKPLVAATVLGAAGIIALPMYLLNNLRESNRDVEFISNSNKINYVQENVETDSRDLELIGIFNYIDKNRQDQDKILNRIFDLKQNNGLPYSEETSVNMASVVGRMAREKPDFMKPYVLDMARLSLQTNYRGEVFDSFSGRDCFLLIQDIINQKSRNGARNTEEIADDVLEKFKESRLYDDYFEEKEGIAKDALDRLGETKLFQGLKEGTEQFYDNFRRRILREEDF